MNKLVHKLQNRVLRKNRVRAKVTGTAERPRLSVYVSNRHVTAQIIDDTNHKTLVMFDRRQKGCGRYHDRTPPRGLAANLPKKAKAAKVRIVVFGPRQSRIYHGRVQALADAARNAGLEF